MSATYTIDNSIDADLKRVITWQYDHARNLTALVLGVDEVIGGETVNIGLIKKFYDAAVGGFWDDMMRKLNIANIPEGQSVSEFGLAVWGKLMGIPRPVVSYQKTDDTEPHQYPMSTDLYTKLLIGRFRLSNSDASYGAYRTFCTYLFGANVKVVDNQDMSLSFSWVGAATPSTNELREQQAAVTDIKDVIFAYPAGVKSSEESDGPVFGFDSQVRPATSSQLVIDNQTVNSSVIVRMEGVAGTTVASGASFLKDSVSWTTSQDYSIPSENQQRVVISGIVGTNIPTGAKFSYDSKEFTIDYATIIRDTGVVEAYFTYSTSVVQIPIGTNVSIYTTTGETSVPIVGITSAVTAEKPTFVDCMFVAAGSKYVKAREVVKNDITMTLSSGGSITSATNLYRSHTDFKIGNFDSSEKAVFAWDRFTDR